MSDNLTPLELEAINANSGYPGTMTAAQAGTALTGILEHGLRYVPGASKDEERRFNDGYAFGLYRARDIVARVEASPSPEPLRVALARAIEGGYADESIDLDLYQSDPVYHAVVYEARRVRLATSPSPEPLRCDNDFFCGSCPDCLTGEHPENRARLSEQP